MDQKTVQAITVGKDGILRVGTQRGLYRFDGAKLRRFSSDRSGMDWISISDIRGIAQNDKGKVFLTTYGGGLLEWSSKHNEFITSPLSGLLTTKYLNVILATDPDTLWIGTISGLKVIDTKFQRDHNFQPGGALVKNIRPPTSIIEGRNGRVYISNTDGIYKYERSTNKLSQLVLNKIPLLANEKITALASIDDDLIGGGTNKGNVFVIDVSNGKVIVKKSTPVNRPTSTSTLYLSLHKKTHPFPTIQLSACLQLLNYCLSEPMTA
jgi:ligand-binding sensor domain-containing protein